MVTMVDGKIVSDMSQVSDGEELGDAAEIDLMA
jgi:hypothetical protein